MKPDDAPVIVEESFDNPPEDVWRALTEVQEMRLWFFANIPDFKPQAGFETRFTVSSGERDFLHIWKVMDVIPLRKLVINWKYGGWHGDSFVIFELSERNNTTSLKLTHHVTKDFPGDVPEFSRESCLAGWSYFISQSLKNYLEKGVHEK